MRTAVRRRARGAFSLVEVVLAIGIVSFAFVGLFGLLPAGLGIFRQAMDNSVGSQIVQRLVNEAQQTDFPTLTAEASATTLRYFDDQGNEVQAVNDSIYTAEITVKAKTVMPSEKNRETESLATVKIKLANNPGHKTVSFDDNVKPGDVPYTTYSALIAKNQ